MTSRATESRLVLAVGAGLALLFVLWPEIDLAVSAAFYGDDGHWRFANEMPALAVAYRGTPLLGKALLGGLALLLAASLLHRTGWLRARRTTLAFLLVAGLLGPVLLVDTALKGHFGRARPAATATFGGDRQFTPAFVPSDQCRSNCTFVSGHVATAAFVMAFGWLGSARLRRRWLAASVLLAAGLAWTRLAVGAHFLSDAVFAWFAVYLALCATEALFALRGWHPACRLPRPALSRP